MTNKKAVFVFGSSKEEICNYFNKVAKTGDLKINSLIEKNRPEIECFEPIYEGNKVYYPFPTFSGAEEPLELKLFCDYGLK